MARRAEIDPQNEPEHDVWSDAWGDPALQELGRRLVHYGLPFGTAGLVVEQTWLFYSYVALPTLRGQFPMGIAAKPSGDHPSVYFYLTFQKPDSSFLPAISSEKYMELQSTFSRDFALPLADQVSMQLSPFEIDAAGLMRWALGPRSIGSIEKRFRAHCRLQQLDYVGIYLDDLVAELGTVMDPEVVPIWLETPNVIFSGRKPADLLRDPLDRQLRDVIARAKFDIPAA